MCEHATNVHLAAVEMNRSSQPAPVASDIEDGKLSNVVRGGKDGPQIDKIIKICSTHNLKPAIESVFRLWVLLPEVAQRFSGDHVHVLIMPDPQVRRNHNLHYPFSFTRVLSNLALNE